MERMGQQDSWTKWKQMSDRKSTWSEFQRVDIQDMKRPGWYHDRVLRVITEAKTQKRALTRIIHFIRPMEKPQLKDRQLKVDLSGSQAAHISKKHCRDLS